MGISMEAQKEAILEKSKKTMSVPEMRRLLGLKKTDSYWLVHRNFFQTYIVNGQMRVDIAVAFRAKCKMFSRHLQKPILKTEKGRFKGL